MNSVVVCALSILAATGGSERAAADPGALVYAERCAICHGQKGQGDGAAARFLYPKPRDFTKGLFKFRSTPEGSLPSDDDLLRTISSGLPGSAMPSFTDLSQDQKMSAIRVVKSFSPKFSSQTPKPPIAVDSPPAASPKLVAQGKQLFADLDCVKCHGKAGLGDGPSAATLKDDWGFAIRPRDLTRGVYKGGGRDEDLFRRIMGGIQGTPMPSFADSIEGADRWAVAAYVKSLAGAVAASVDTVSEIQAGKVSGEIAKDPSDSRWESIPAANVRLMPLWERGKSISTAAVRAMHNGKELAIQVEWEDSEVASNFVSPEQFVDAAAIQFPVGAGLPSFTMGEAGKPVNVWYWRADREVNAAPITTVSAHPNVAEDQRVNRDPVYYTGAAVGNPVSLPSTVEELNAEGFGTLTTQPKAQQSVKGGGAWIEGRWVVVFTRALGKTSAADATLKAGGHTPVAFAIWDGTQRDRNGQKAVTNWLTLRLAK
ncbi:MAG: c-type cytochrome [Nitrospirae bacterium]|nr:c-type cytochrome [Nitrospirota bacterium]